MGLPQIINWKVYLSGNNYAIYLQMNDDEKSKRPQRYRAREPKPPVFLTDDRKRSPNRLRRVLNAVRETFDPTGILKHPRFMEILLDAWSERGSRYGVKDFTRNIFRATEEGTAPLQYWQLECYGHATNIPSGVFLIISRLLNDHRHVRDTETHDDEHIGKALTASQICDGVRGLLDHYQANIAPKPIIDDADIKSLLDEFTKSTGARRA